MAEMPERRVWVTSGSYSHVVEACVIVRQHMPPEIIKISQDAANAIQEAFAAVSQRKEEPA